MLEQVYPEETKARGQPMLEQTVTDCIPWGVPTLEHGKSVRRKERQREAVTD